MRRRPTFFANGSRSSINSGQYVNKEQLLTAPQVASRKASI
jgi:hypothetical protein